jgi:hypothetical protein
MEATLFPTSYYKPPYEPSFASRFFRDINTSLAGNFSEEK